MAQPKGFVDTQYLRATAALLGQIKQRSYVLMHIQPGQSLLDVGCGPGTDTIPLARIVGQAGQVTGVDYDPAMVAEAQVRASKADASGWVCHKQADAALLPFPTGTFDACRSERLFQHVSRPAQVLAEMLRVTKSSGWVVVVDTDWSSFSVDSIDVDIERRLAGVLAQRVLQNGCAGRQLFRLFRQQQIQDICIEMVAVHVTRYAIARQIGCFDIVEHEALQAGIITQDELARWRSNLERADAEDMFFASASVVIVAGRKP
jgi:ubiquinone/menaquinone biosynthesis C-methylase UbiE